MYNPRHKFFGASEMETVLFCCMTRSAPVFEAHVALTRSAYVVRTSKQASTKGLEIEALHHKLFTQWGGWGPRHEGTQMLKMNGPPPCKKLRILRKTRKDTGRSAN